MRQLILCLALLLAIAARGSAQYQAVWNEDGRITFIQVVSDSSVVFMEVQYAPHKGATSPYVSFEQWALRSCDKPRAIETAYIAGGGREADALKSRQTEPLTWRAIPFDLQEQEYFRASIGCSLIERRRRSR